jgi:diacylglycerol kinase family enzyme
LGNVLTKNAVSKSVISDPQDGILETVVLPSSPLWNFWQMFKKEKSKKSVFPTKKIKIESPKNTVSVVADGQKIMKTPVDVEIVPAKLKIIVGRERRF